MPKNLEDLYKSKVRILKAMSKLKNNLEKLQENEVVRSYIRQGRRIISLNESLIEIEKKIKREKILNCKHISIMSNAYSISDKSGKKIYRHYGCIKCGMDTRNMDGIYPDGPYNSDSYPIDYMPEQIENELRKGIIIDISCEYDTVKQIYNNIIKKYPNITDEQAVNNIKKIIKLVKNKNRTDKEKVLILSKPYKYI